MTKEEFSRTALLLGEEATERLQKARVAVFGIGGVGGHAAEALVRSGIGSIDLIDNDTVSVSNINRQLFALHSTVGMQKTEAAKLRLLDINPDLKITVYNTFFLPENAHEFDFSVYDYVIDAVDTVKAKLAIIECAKKSGVPVISSMGAGNKLDPTSFKVADIAETSVCPLARVMRTELKKRGIRGVPVVYSKETPIKPGESHDFDNISRRQVPGSCAFVPSVVGLIIAGEVVKAIGSRDGNLPS